MPSENEHERILKLLRPEPLQHVVTLKMLHLLGTRVEFRFLEMADGWALLTLFPANAFEYDRQTYPDQDQIVLVDGSSESGKLELVGALPQKSLVVKTYDEVVAAFLESRRSARRVRSFLSFTTDDRSPLPPQPPGIVEGMVLTPDVARMFAANGYLDSELARHFADGAHWFSARTQEGTGSAGFVFRNFGAVWEIGGVFTDPEFRRQGLARRVVAAALRHLVTSGRIPRYQVRSDNFASIKLAKASGLREFLRMEHLLLNPHG